MENTEETVETVDEKLNSKTDEQAVEAGGAEEAESAEMKDESSEQTDEVAAKKEEKEEETFKEKFYYLAAEMQNLQKRFDREKQNLLKFGNEKILNDMVEILDNFERTLGFIEKDEDEKVKNIVVGIQMIHKLFLETLEKHGLKQIEALGQEFDPNFHEALAQQPAEGKKDMEVILVHQNGYTLNERVIRAAKVVVAKNE
ncbi:MAG: nucleotide exchange factor GrpE [Halobacteriovoraceae bacterium]|nr:nucleotide exchange factor GrpE [Halobacteriovoraceae bacterium]|tara:strand:- start:1605 stop:2204 length:600 start_codon:yes stop_codon:yes gene_type:complete